MIPFSGFMQAISGSAPGFGAKTVGHGNCTQRLPGFGDAQAPMDAASGSFLGWVHQLMDSGAPGGTEGEKDLAALNSQPEADMPPLEQLPPPIAEGLDQAPAVQPIPQTPNFDSPNNRSNPVLPGTLGTLVAPDSSSAAVGKQAREDGANPLPTGTIDTVGHHRAVKAHDDVRSSAEKPVHRPLPADQEMLAEKDVPAVAGRARSFPNDRAPQTNLSGIPAQTGTGDDTHLKGNPLQGAQEKLPKQGLEKEKTPFAFKPDSPPSDAVRASTHRVIPEPWSAGSGIPTKAIDIAPPHKHAAAGPTDASAPMATAITDEKPASSEDDTADFQGKNKHHPTQRIALARINENELTRDHSSDSVKSAVPETTKSHPSFQDTAKAIAAEPSPTAADKPAIGQAGALTRTEAAAARTFQTTVMDQIVDKAAMRSIHGRSEIQIRLKPEFLGNVQMNIATDKQQLVVRIVADQAAVKEIIETSLHHLKTELQNQGLTIDKIDVMVNPDPDQPHNREQFAQMFKHNSFQNGRRQPQDKHPEEWNRGGGNDPEDDQPNREGVNYFA